MKGRHHHYTCDTIDRRLVHVFLAILSILLAYLLNRLEMAYEFQIPWWVDAPAVFGFYGALYIVFKKRLWKKKFIRTIFFIETPNWNGTYECSLQSSHDNFETKTAATLTIKQDWDSMLILLKTETSKSESLSGSFSMKDLIEPVLTYEYMNYPNPDASSDMQIHHGMASIRLDQKKLQGDYFNGRGRNRFGKFNQVD